MMMQIVANHDDDDDDDDDDDGLHLHNRNSMTLNQ